MKAEYKDILEAYQVGPLPLQKSPVGTFMEEDPRLTLYSYSIDQVNRLVLPMVKDKYVTHSFQMLIFLYKAI